MKFLKYFKFFYLIFACLFFIDTIINWSVDRSRAYLSLFFVIIAVFIFFFRSKYQKRFEERGKL